MRYSLFAGLLLLAAGCSTPQSRIRRHQAAFDAYPPEVQRKIRAGEVAVGFTREQASMALGRPDRVRTRQSSAGEQEVWVYGIGAPRPDPALVSAPGAYVAPPLGADELRRVIFQKGSIVAIENQVESPP